MRFLFWRRQRRDEELEEEIQAHLEMAKRDRMELGATAEEAQAAARREFGNIGLVKEVTREMWGWRWLEQLGQDLHYGVRMLMKKPGFTLTVVITLALGIGANTALFSVVNVVLLNPFPYPGHSRIHYVWQRLPKIGVQERYGTSGPEFTELAQCKAFERVAAISANLSRNLTGGQEPERITVARVSGNFFPILGVTPSLGRAIKAEDQGPKGERVLVINHSLWQRRFGGNPDIVGQKVLLDAEPFTIIGVMPPKFYFADREAFIPYLFDLNQSERFFAVARLKPGVSVDQANAELEVMARNQEQALGNSRPEYVGRGVYLRPISEFYFDQINRVLVVLLGAVGLVLLIACANIANLLTARSLIRLMNVDPGFNPENVLTMRLNIPPSRSGDGQQNAVIFQQLSERIRTVPGVQSVGVASHIPFDQTATETVTVESNVAQGGAQTENVDTRTVSTDFLEVMGIRLIEGERFTSQDRQDAPHVVIINQAMARRFWANEGAVGKRLKLGSPTSGAPWTTVKGVVADSAQISLSASIRPEVYFPHSQAPNCCRRMNLVVLTSVDPASLIGPIKREIQSLYKDQPVYNVRTMEEFIARSACTRRFAMTLLGVFAGLALALASVGVYGVISYSVAQRAREFGIRIAMGAQARDVLKLVVMQGMMLVSIGVAIGLFASFALTRLTEGLLFGVSAKDPLTFATVALLLTLVALLACWIPARRATKVDPLVALRCE